MKYFRMLEASIRGFMSIGEVSLSLDSQGLVRVKGVNKCNSFDSNGSGKSALFEAIQWAFVGETTKGIKKDEVINKYWEGYAEVEILFDYNKNTYRIIRRRNHPEFGNDTYFEVNGSDESGPTMTKTNQIIESSFPFLSSDLLQSIMILGQGMPSKFTDLTPASRKASLEEISDSVKVVDNLKDRFKNYINDLSAERESYLMDISSKETLKESKEKEKEKLERKKSEIEDHEDYLSKDEIKKIKDEINTLTDKRKKLVSDKELKQDDKSRITNKITSVESKKEELKNTLKQNKENLSTLRSDDGEKSVCYTCGSVLDGEEKEGVAENLEKDLISNISETKKSIRSCIEKLSFLGEKEQEFAGEVSDLNSSISNIEETILEKREILSNQPETDVSVEYLGNKVGELIDEIKDAEKELESLNKSLHKIDDKLAIAKHLKRLVSREFRSYLLGSVVKYLNHKLKEYSKVVYQDVDTQIVSMVLDGNSLEIFFGDRSYESLSGGERRRVDIVIQFVLRDLSINEAGVGFNLLVLDEIFDNLDETGIENILELIKIKNEDLESIYQVSHRTDLFIPADKEVTVIKNPEGVSHIETGVA